jgi:hypothetical protein
LSIRSAQYVGFGRIMLGSALIATSSDIAVELHLPLLWIASLASSCRMLVDLDNAGVSAHSSARLWIVPLSKATFPGKFSKKTGSHS